MELAKMTSKGQLTIPAAVRKRLGIGKGDQILFYEQDGRMIMAPVTPASLASAQAAVARLHVYTPEELRAVAGPIAARSGLRRLSLFGSYARGEATPESDIDLLADVPEDFGLFKLAGLREELEEALHKPVDLVTAGGLQTPGNEDFARRILEDEVILYDSHAAATA